MDAKPYLKEIQLKTDTIPSYENYPFSIPAIRSLSSLKFHPDVTFIVGENGSGKSTLIEAISLYLGFSIEGGSQHVNLQTHANSSSLYQHLKGIKSFRKPSDYFFLRAESLYNVATYLEDIYRNNSEAFAKQYGVKSLHECSHGESFMALLLNKLKGNGLYIFDEPEAALSPSRQLTALSAIHKLVQNGSQFIIATHSPLLLAYPNAVIYQLDDSGIKQLRYDETEHYIVTKHFLNHTQEMLDIILNPEGEDNLDE